MVVFWFDGIGGVFFGGFWTWSYGCCLVVLRCGDIGVIWEF
jgi:hypothetical protein